MAAADAPQGQPHPPWQAILFNGLVPIRGAGRLEPTRRRNLGREEDLIQTYKNKAKSPHRSLLLRVGLHGRANQEPGPGEDFFQRSSYLPEVRRPGSYPSAENHVPSLTDWHRTGRFPHEALDPVPFHSLSHMLADPEGKSGGPLHVRLSFQPQQGIVPAPPLFAYNGQPFCIRESPPSIQAYATVSLFLPLSRRAFSTRRP